MDATSPENTNGPWIRIPREVKEWPSFATMADAVGLDREAIDSRLEGLLFVIARVPEMFHTNGRLSIAVCAGDPQLRIWFTYDEHHVILLGIERQE